MDRTTDLTDAFVEVKFADLGTYRTQIRRRTLNPVWSEDFRFASISEVSDDADLQNEPLELKIMDYDQITYNDAIGTVFIDLNPLLTWDSPAQISGWFPVYDTLLGVRGELNAQVKLQLFGDINPFKDSSAGVQFFTVPTPPPNYQIVSVLGFVSALDNEDDPEYHWSDNFRTPRKSNEARTRAMFRLSGHIRRQLGKKVLELNGNAVLGFKQLFDLEEENKTISARAIGTAVKLVLINSSAHNNELSASSASLQSVSLAGQPLPRDLVMFGSPTMPPSLSMATGVGIDLMNEMENDDILGLPLQPILPLHVPWRQTDQAPLTLDEFPRGAILGIGGLVSATSVKMLDKDERDVRSVWWTELRDEIKLHARSLRCPYIIGYTEQCSINNDLALLHCTGTASWVDITLFNTSTFAASLATQINEPGGSGGGSHPILRTEWVDPSRDSTTADGAPPKHSGSVSTKISPISTFPVATGQPIPASSSARVGDPHRHASVSDETSTKRHTTAAPPVETAPSHSALTSHTSDRSDLARPRTGNTPRRESLVSGLRDGEDRQSSRRRAKRRLKHLSCRASHITYRRSESPFPMALTRCGICKRKYVPEVLLTTIEPPPELEMIGKGIFIEALVCRQKKPRVSESRAVSVSESIPFAQYDLHRQLMYKLRMYGLNAIFGLKIQISMGENLMTAVAIGTAVYVRSLPTPPSLKVFRNLEVVDEEDEKLMDLQRKIISQSETNRKRIEEALEMIQKREEEERTSRSDSDEDTNSSKSEDDDDIESPGAGLASMGNSGHITASATMAAAAAASGGGAGGINPMGVRSQQQQIQQHQQRGVVVQIDDEQDEDLVLFLEQTFPDGFEIFSVQTPPNSQDVMKNLQNFQMVTMVKQGTINAVSHHPNRQLAGIFRTLHLDLQYQVAYFSPCYVTGIRYNVQLPKEQGVQVTLQAMVIGGLPKRIDGVKAPGFTQSNSILNLFEQVLLSSSASGIVDRRISSLQRQTTGKSSLSNMDGASIASSVQDDMLFGLDEDAPNSSLPYQGSTTSTSYSNAPFPALYNGSSGLNAILGGAASRIGAMTGMVTGMVTNMTLGMSGSEMNTPVSPSQATAQSSTFFGQQPSSANQATTHPPLAVTIPPHHLAVAQPFLQTNVELSPNSWIPRSKIVRFLGRISMHFIKEVNLVYDGLSGKFGMGGFTHMFLAELFAVVKAHTAALGGNGMIGFSMDQVLFSESIKNMGYAFVSVSGDVVVIEYLPADSDANIDADFMPPMSSTSLSRDADGGPPLASYSSTLPLAGPTTGLPSLASPSVASAGITASDQNGSRLPESISTTSTPRASVIDSAGGLHSLQRSASRDIAFDHYIVVPQCDFATELFRRSST
ncbi:hypothetical protein BSLG_008365 [Batrachochytrium salamandrivorans]|nr:hypothetical protein BSLG_008365 [Batrachochytrium salamandrivorans]